MFSYLIGIEINNMRKEVYSMTATPNLLQWQVYKYLKEQIENIK